MSLYNPPLPIPCKQPECTGTLEYKDDEYNGLSGGGDYEIWKCNQCGALRYFELPD